MSDLHGLTGSITNLRARERNSNIFTGGVREFAVEVPIQGLGEITRQIWFPASYVEKPLHSWGFELSGGATLHEYNAVPLASVMIRSWNLEEVPDSNVLLYKGCRASFYTTSPKNFDIQQNFSFTLFFTGRAVSRPGRI